MIKYLCKKGMTPKKIHEDFMKTLGYESACYSTVKKWAAEFKRGRENTGDDARSGRRKDATTDENMANVHNLVMCDRRRDLRSIASEEGISYGAVQTILTDILGMSKVSARWVPRMLTDRLDISRYLLSRYEDDSGDFIDKMRHGFITLTQSRICRACNGSTLVHLFPRSLRDFFFRQGR